MNNQVLLLLFSSLLTYCQDIYYISPNGNDSWPGTKQQPKQHIYFLLNSFTSGNKIINVELGEYNDEQNWNINFDNISIIGNC